MSHADSHADSLAVPCGQMSQGLRLSLLEKLLELQQILKENLLTLMVKGKHHSLILEQQKKDLEEIYTEVIDKQKIARLMDQMISLLQFVPHSDKEPQLPPHFLGSEPPSGVWEGEPSREVSLLHEAYTISKDHNLSTRGEEVCFLYRSGFEDYMAYLANKYHEDNNSSGIINLGISENKLCTDLITERFKRSDMAYLENSLLQYNDWTGRLFLRQEIANFLYHYCKAPSPLDPENVVVLNGCCSIFSALSMVLCDAGEAFLIPTPFYGGFTLSAKLYTKVELFHVHLDSKITDENKQPFQLTVKKLEDGLLKAMLKGKKIKGLILNNPQNPLGYTYSQDSLKEYLTFAKRYKLHVIIDEIYMLSVFDPKTTFHSVLSLDSLPDPQRTHVIWGTSKDFGISGFRFGALYTHNKDVAAAVRGFSYLHSLSGIAQYKLCQLLKDRVWIDNTYLPSYKLRLQRAYRCVTKQLDALEIPYLKGGCGLYVWINLKKYLTPCTFEKELDLYRHLMNYKVILTRGKIYMCKEPGWFRLVFAEKTHILLLAMQRFSEALKEYEQIAAVEFLEDAYRSG
ncbi:PREDICTED: probable inactive 1-aminocyclopropane-1-carboxylate synthase-like protein 2 [Elephantulus edwardii]|uniref:probable inactive 1-aminocyclopropane-1-carboxylate synthase-like protein 2 n=1 Tax=Elephantulus edwardii TaxID=28737 RepID=UPI0003F0E363|nr:PREDICTED: probable inactive 1-aminocyclopropane-1-carboxylate synthase-like protein 2 [Elephantulus edwardii]